MHEDPPDLEPIDLAAAQAGWYADPWTSGQYRYWNGDAWTADTHWPAPAAPVTTTPAMTRSPAMPAPMYPAARNPRGSRIAAVVAGLVALMLVAGAIGYAIEASTENDSPGETRRPSTSVPGPIVPAPDAADRAALGGLVVQQADVAPDNVVVLIPNGNRTTQPTLDLCNGKFASEKLRVARLQVLELDNAENALLSTEAVTYRNAAATAAGFAELRRVRAACPRTPVTSPVGEETAATVFKAAPDGRWPRTPSVERQAYSFTTTAGVRTSESIAVYLRRGRVLLGLYFPQPNGPQSAVEGKTSIPGIVGVFEARMARLPAKVVGDSG
jgi:hypothetical protein